MRKSRSALCLILVVCIAILSGCASSPQNALKKGTNEEITIVSTSVAICEILDEFGFDNVIGVPETSRTLLGR